MTDMKRWFRAVSGLLIIGFFVLILVSSFHLGIGDFKTPGPGFTSFLASALALLLSLFVFVREAMGSMGYADETPSPLLWKNLSKPAGAVIVLFGFVLLIKAFGYPFAGFFLMFGMFFIYNPAKWPVHIVIAAAIAVGTYFIFQTWLGVEFPSGDILSIGW